MIGNNERDVIRDSAKTNAEKPWLKNLNPYDPRDIRHGTYNGDYQAAGGKN